MNDDHKYWTCTRKVRYDTFKAAWTHLAKKAGRRRHKGRWARGMGTYHCVYCNGYHNGHDPTLDDTRQPMRVLRRQWAELRERLHTNRRAKTRRG